MLQLIFKAGNILFQNPALLVNFAHFLPAPLAPWKS
jgi:hypothetical protein